MMMHGSENRAAKLAEWEGMTPAQRDEVRDAARAGDQTVSVGGVNFDRYVLDTEVVTFNVRQFVEDDEAPAIAGLVDVTCHLKGAVYEVELPYLLDDVNFRIIARPENATPDWTAETAKPVHPGWSDNRVLRIGSLTPEAQLAFSQGALVAYLAKGGVHDTFPCYRSKRVWLEFSRPLKRIELIDHGVVLKMVVRTRNVLRTVSEKTGPLFNI